LADEHPSNKCFKIGYHWVVQYISPAPPFQRHPYETGIICVIMTQLSTFRM
jgi:hypothetical protein